MCTIRWRSPIHIDFLKVNVNDYIDGNMGVNVSGRIDRFGLSPHDVVNSVAEYL